MNADVTTEYIAVVVAVVVIAVGAVAGLISRWWR